MEWKHSGLGIASFSISIICGIVTILTWMFNSGYFFYFSLGTLIMSSVALGLGLGGLIQIDRKKLFAILGTIFSVLLICCIGLALLFWFIFATSYWS
jgi:hypothetical protein